MAEQDGKRVIEQQATSEVFADDWFLKDSVTEGTTKISSENLKAWINDGMATKGDIETVVKNIVDTYSESESYAEGDLCIHEYALFKCTGTTTGTWDSTKWQATTVAELLDSIDLSAEAISYDNTSSGLEADNVQDAIDEVLSALKIVRDIPNTPTAIATFSDGSDLPMPKLEVGIEPQQDLHGYDAPWVGGAGKNKYPIAIGEDDWANNGGATHTNSNGQLVISTSASSDYSGIYVGENSKVKEVLTGMGANVRVISFDIVASVSTPITVNCGATTSMTATTTKQRVSFASTNNGLTIYAQSTASNITISNLQIELGSTATSYAPYSNICPISGWDEVNVGVAGKNLLNPAMVNKTSNQLWKWYDTEGFRLKANTKYSLTNFTTDANIQMYIKDFATDNALVSSNNFASYTPTSDVIVYFQAYRGDGIADSSLFQLEIGDRTSYHAYNGATYTIDLDGTRYGGEVDVVSGVLTVDRVGVDLGDLNWTYSNGFFRTADLNSLIKKPVNNNTKVNAISSMYVAETWNAISSTNNGKFAVSAGTSDPLIVCNAEYTDATTFKAAMDGVQLVYELATPLTIQLTPTAVKSLRGMNNVYADSGDVRDGKYIADASSTIASLDARITALENQ